MSRRLTLLNRMEISPKVPTLAVMENMAHFDTPAGERFYPFGKGHLPQLQEK
jgi:hypothetical protein